MTRTLPITAQDFPTQYDAAKAAREFCIAEGVVRCVYFDGEAWRVTSLKGVAKGGIVIYADGSCSNLADDFGGALDLTGGFGTQQWFSIETLR